MKTKLAVLFSAATAVCLGAILTAGSIVPTAALSYGAWEARTETAARALPLSFPVLSPDPQWTEGSATEPEAEGNGESAEAVFAEADYTAGIPERPDTAKSVIQKQYASSLSVNNSSPKEIDIPALLEKIPDIDLSGDGPQILIVHTHTTESYNETAQDWYTGQDTRSDDSYKNMVHMGELLETALNQRGYSVVHCQTIHDEDFNYSYTKSNRSVRDYLEKYPSISVVIDLHRDSLIDGSGTKYRPTVTIEGEETAQVMLLMGVGNDIYPHPDWKENLSLALRIQAAAQEKYPGLMRPVLVRPSRYNQYLSNGAILVELGACGNRPEEAERAAVRFGEICADALDQIRKEQG